MQGAIFLEDNYSRGQLSGGQLSGRQFSSAATVQTPLLQESFIDRNNETL